MPTWVDIISLIGVGLTVGGYSVKDLLNNSDKHQMEAYIRWLSHRDVLTISFDQEVLDAVVHSIEDIKKKTEDISANCKEANTRTFISHVISVMHTELGKLHELKADTPESTLKMVKSIQRFRLEMGRTLAVICGAYHIDPNSTELTDFILHQATQRYK